ncbi:hypothetical protein PSN45_004683 [Yamadazyma tenuis]|uniref:Phosphatidate phosphatase APP1 catalytic domain-containing protein n=1 Tax=Candida tenuis (strain ATCC 10573 / BCRC 21748 / CBS 615 / JCM 9827 / NBRC 10315 / NRRL Y-1498 / VKM Y-70) TaxID=590646 RepID=G3B6Y2_CANTC|nr:uncharacterized protein CANTEDRAFT_130596 [Yamadazyma tenuis ATCC 10573]EGV63048.1 hypothetical protein CANTEDRAFT_130596 [Yamadazyma tenuis ATCC 10573]WEJ97135.1 hypothetical protein PSN45_004683 [Yamadazyma tenuis]
MSDPSSYPSSTSSSASDVGSRRQRIFGLARTARDVYIPRISDSVTQLATGVSTRAFANDKYDPDGNIRVPEDASITLYPTYTRQDPDGNYHVDVGGWLACPGAMTRKNRLILSLVKQIVRYDNSATSTAISNLESDGLQPDTLDDSDAETISSVDTTSSAYSNNDETLRTRLAAFIARFVANAKLTVTVGSRDELETSKLVSKDVFTDRNGCFSDCITVPYVPGLVQVVAGHQPAVFACEPVDIVSNDGVAIISDIDDTVKLTGVTGDKRTLLTSLLLQDVKSWTISPVVSWYNQLCESNKVTFHYVSNSPVQLLPTLLQYFTEVGLPSGSMHLKQYTGNLMASLMEPSSSRKRTVLTKLAEDFPRKRFVCVGDSGEYDFESYVDLASRYPGKLAAIYIRVVPNSMSFLKEDKIVDEVNRILTKPAHEIPRPINPRSVSTAQQKINPEDLEDLIDLSDTIPELPHKTKLPPTIPKKPSSLRGNLVRKPPPSSPESLVEMPPKLPTRPSTLGLAKAHTDTEVIGAPDLPPRRRPATTIAYETPTRDEILDNLHNIYYSHHFEDLQSIDGKGAEWIERAMTGAKMLENTGTKVRFFRDDEDDLYDTTCEVLKDIVRESK